MPDAQISAFLLKIKISEYQGVLEKNLPFFWINSRTFWKNSRTSWKNSRTSRGKNPRTLSSVPSWAWMSSRTPSRMTPMQEPWFLKVTEQIWAIEHTWCLYNLGGRSFRGRILWKLNSAPSCLGPRWLRIQCLLRSSSYQRDEQSQKTHRRWGKADSSTISPRSGQ